MDSQAIVDTRVSKLSNERKAELFDRFVLGIVPFLWATRAVEYLLGHCNIKDLVAGDDEGVLGIFFGPMTDEEASEVLKKILPKLIENELGAKRVVIKW
jgi:hypothetical protein